MSFGSTALPSASTLNVYNPPPVTPPAAPASVGPAPAPPAPFGASGGSAPLGTKPTAKSSQPTFLGAGLTPTQGGTQTGAPSLLGQGPQVSPSSVAAVSPMAMGKRASR